MTEATKKGNAHLRYVSFSGSHGTSFYAVIDTSATSANRNLAFVDDRGHARHRGFTQWRYSQNRNRNQRKFADEGEMCRLRTLQLLLVATALVNGEHATFQCNLGSVSSRQNRSIRNNGGPSLVLERVLPVSLEQTHFCEAATHNPRSFLRVTARTTGVQKGKREYHSS